MPRNVIKIFEVPDMFMELGIKRSHVVGYVLKKIFEYLVKKIAFPF